MPLETAKWDTTKYLKSEEDIAAYLEAVFEDGDPALVAHALGEIARAEGTIHVSKAGDLDCRT
jgi:probable addiction module antidote protein